MVQQLSSRETALRELNENLERRVDERTTELRQSEEALRTREAEVSAIMNATLAGLVTVADNGAIKSFNPAAEKLFGYTEKEAIGLNIALLIPGIDQDACNKTGIGNPCTGKRLEQLAAARQRQHLPH